MRNLIVFICIILFCTGFSFKNSISGSLSCPDNISECTPNTPVFIVNGQKEPFHLKIKMNRKSLEGDWTENCIDCVKEICEYKKTKTYENYYVYSVKSFSGDWCNKYIIAYRYAYIINKYGRIVKNSKVYIQYKEY